MELLVTSVKAIMLIMGILAGWLGVQYAYRRFAWRHPEFGPAQEHLGCGMACTCHDPCDYRDNGQCTKNQTKAETSEGEQR
jgi:hypothetical protein